MILVLVGSQICSYQSTCIMSDAYPILDPMLEMSGRSQNHYHLCMFAIHTVMRYTYLLMVFCPTPPPYSRPSSEKVLVFIWSHLKPDTTMDNNNYLHVQ